MRERCQCAVTERMCEDSGRIYADTGQEMHRPTEVGAMFNRAVSVLRCECALTATETLRGEGMRANSGGIYVETMLKECTDSDS